MTIPLDSCPEAFDEHNCPDIFWKPDPYDEFVPEGFISDLVYHLRGMEIPTAYVIWSALFALSTGIKREAWLAWFPKPLYLNLYTIIVGPPGVVKKTAAADLMLDLLKGVPDLIEDPNLRRMKKYSIVKNKVTPEAMLDAMLPSKKKGSTGPLVDEDNHPILDEAGNMVVYRATSEMSIVLHEMAVSVSKRSYSETMIELLLDLFDCHEDWEWKTLSRGTQKLKNLYTTFFAATTPSGFKTSIPEVAAGDGFLSRTVVVYQGETSRVYPKPRVVHSAPSWDMLKARLAWLVQNCLDEYDLSPRANAAYEKWYYRFKKDLQDDQLNQGLRSRLDILLLKVSTLIRMSRYDNSDRIVHLRDFEAARLLIGRTYIDSAKIVHSVTGNELNKQCEVVEMFIMKRGEVKRLDLLRGLHYSAEEVNQALDYLQQCSRISIYGNGVLRNYPSRDSQEVYKYHYAEASETTKEPAENWAASPI